MSGGLESPPDLSRKVRNASVTSALRSVGLGLLDEHLRGCVRDAVDNEPDRGDAKIREAVGAIERLLRV